MKISIIGAGNVGALTAMRLAQEGFPGIILVDVAKGLSKAKSLDLEDAQALVKQNYRIEGTENLSVIKDSEIIVVSAGLTRKPGMSREKLLAKNVTIVKETCEKIRLLSPKSIVIIVTNPLDLMTYAALKVTGFQAQGVFGMGISLDASRFANLIAVELKIPVTDVEAIVIGSHGEGMVPLPRLTNIKGVSLEEFLDEKKIESLVARTINRGAEIVSLLGSGSASFAPSAAIAELVRVIARDEKRIIGISAYLSGQYGVKDVCIGVPCRLGKNGIEQIIEYDLNQSEKQAFLNSAASLKKQYSSITI